MSLEAIVLGNGPGWEEELDSVYEEGRDIIAINRGITLCPYKIRYGVSNHIKHLKEQASQLSYPVDIISLQGQEYPWNQVTSGFAAIKKAIDLGYKRVYVAGIPLSDKSYDLVAARNYIYEIAQDINKYVVAPGYYWWVMYVDKISTTRKVIYKDAS